MRAALSGIRGPGQQVGVEASDRKVLPSIFDRCPQTPQGARQLICSIGEGGTLAGHGSSGDDPLHLSKRLPGGDEICFVISRQQFAGSVEEDRQCQPGWHVVFRVSLGLERGRMQGGHHRRRTAVVKQSLAEHQGAFCKPLRLPHEFC